MGEWKSLKTDIGTGWKEIYREAGTGWKALEWEGGVAIDVGGACLNRIWYYSLSNTLVLKENPANAAGILTNVCIYMSTGSSEDAYIGTFYALGGTQYKCRDAENVGSLSNGENNKNVSLVVEVGDLIGIYQSGGKIEAVLSGNAGGWYKSGNKVVIDLETYFSSLASATASLYGTG